MGGLIAVVEDEPELQALYRLVLKSKGYRVAYVSADAEDAVCKYEHCPVKPDLVIMDEPTKGLDPLVQQTFMEVIREEAARGKTIFMSSHVLSEVEKVCNRVAIIRDGLIVAEENMESLKRKSGKVIEVKFRGAKPEPFMVAGAGNVAKLDGYYKMTATGDIRSVLRDLAAFDVEDVNIHPMTLDDIFMQYYAAGGSK